MAEGERVEWPEVYLVRDQDSVLPWAGWREVRVEPPEGLEPHLSVKRYLPEDAFHFTHLVGGLEAEIQQLRDREARSKKRRAERLAAIEAIKAEGPKDIVEVAGLRSEASAYAAVGVAAREDADRLQALLDLHKKEGRWDAS